MGVGSASGVGLKSCSVMSRPASRSSTSRPRSVSSLTAMLPEAPEPMTRASKVLSIAGGLCSVNLFPSDGARSRQGSGVVVDAPRLVLGSDSRARRSR